MNASDSRLREITDAEYERLTPWQRAGFFAALLAVVLAVIALGGMAAATIGG